MVVAEPPTTRDEATPPTPRDYISFRELAKKLGYDIPADVPKQGNKATAQPLIDLAATLGESYLWDGKKQQFYRPISVHK